MSKRNQAVALLQHYIGLGMPNGKLSSDNRAEVESIVDLIIDAAIEKLGIAFAPPITPAQGRSPYHSAAEPVHAFEKVEGNPYCGYCGGGKLHHVHQKFVEPLSGMPEPASNDTKEIG